MMTKVTFVRIHLPTGSRTVDSAFFESNEKAVSALCAWNSGGASAGTWLYAIQRFERVFRPERSHRFCSNGQLIVL